MRRLPLFAFALVGACGSDSDGRGGSLSGGLGESDDAASGASLEPTTEGSDGSGNPATSAPASETADTDPTADDSGTTDVSASGNDTSSSAVTDDTAGSTSGNDTTTGEPADPCTFDPTPAPCDTIDGADVYCVAPGDVVTMPGEVSYPPGFPDGLPALGVGSPGLGYIPVATPATCVPLGCDHATGLGNSEGSGGKICEVSFDNTLQADAIGTARYAITIDGNAAAGDYHFGFLTNDGATATSPEFWLRVGP